MLRTFLGTCLDPEAAARVSRYRPSPSKETPSLDGAPGGGSGGAPDGAPDLAIERSVRH